VQSGLSLLRHHDHPLHGFAKRSPAHAARGLVARDRVTQRAKQAREAAGISRSPGQEFVSHPCVEARDLGWARDRKECQSGKSATVPRVARIEEKRIPQRLARARKALDERPLLRTGLFALLLVGMTVAAYAPALEAGFVWDDDDYVTANPLLPAADGLWRIWFTMDAPSQYVPVVYSALRLQYAFFGLEPFGYHLVNILLQAPSTWSPWPG